MKKLLTKALQAIAKVGEAMPKENAAVVDKPAEPKPWRISSFAVDIVKSMRPASSKKPAQAYTPPKGVIPDGEATTMAMDFAGAMGATPVFNAIEYAQQYNISMGFPGYAVLAELTQVSEYRSPVETIAKEMTRKWGEIKSTGDEDRSEQIKQIVAEFNRLGIKEVCRQLIEHDGFYGRGQVYIDLEMSDDDELPLTVSSKTIKQGSLKRLKAIEPMWTAAQQYNADNPLNPNFYKPSMWFLFGKKIHDSRLITIVSRPVPDMLKPAYNFGGISLTQLIVPYVDNWLSSRQTVNDLLRKFSTSGFKTDMGTILTGGGSESLINRAEVFNAMRDNFGTLLIDKDKEEFFQFNVPLSGIDKLQAQAQEQMASPTHIPLVKLFGITPSGLNATSEGEIQVWHEYLRAEQENVLDKPVHKILQIVQLSLFGEIYDDIVFEWNPLAEMTEEQQANVNKTKADTGASLIEAGIISQEEERTRIATDPMSGYNGLDIDDVPEMPDDGDMPDESDKDEEVGENADDPKLAIDGNPNHSAENGEFVSGGNTNSKENKSSKPPKQIPSSANISTMDEAKKYWDTHFKGKTYQLKVSSRKGQHEPLDIEVDFGNTNHAFSEKPDGASHDNSERKLSLERAKNMDKILDTIQNPYMKLISRGNDLLLSAPAKGRFYTVSLTWREQQKKYTFESAHFKTQKQIEGIRDNQRNEKKNKNKGSLQK